MPRRVSSSAGTEPRAALGRAAWKNIAAAGLPVLACFLGGATEKWAEGIVVALLGLLLVFNPPRFSLGWKLNAIFLGFVGFVACAFLPAHLFFIPAWRAALTNDFGIDLANTITPQPWITLGAFGSLIAGLSWLYYVATQELDLRSVRAQFRIFAFGIISLAAICILLKLNQAAPQFWHNERGFGPFPNRNQTADLLGLTAIVVLACGQDSVRRGTKGWILWLPGFAILVAAIVINFSRAGLLILVIGSTVWVAGLALHKSSRSTSRLAVWVSILLVLLTAVLIFGGGTLERFHLRTGDAEAAGISTDFRWLIYRDAARLIGASPWSGIGLGNFESVFAIFRDASLANTRSLHPESDWIWLCSEAGWPTVLLALLGFALLAVRVFPLQEGTNQRFRRAGLIGAVLFAVHGVVDVSGHRVGTAFAAIFLLGLALFRPFQFPRNAAVPWLFRLLGLLLMASSSLWMWAIAHQTPLPGGIGSDNARYSATLANRGSDFAGAIQSTTQALRWAPLDWQLYFLRGVAHIGSRHRAEFAVADFRRARFLEPNSYEVPLEEGKIWLPSRPMLAVTAWQEALRRAGPQRAGVYSYLLSIAPLSRPEVDRGLGSLAAGKPDLLLIYFGRLSDERVKPALEQFVVQDPELTNLTAADRAAFFNVWEGRGDREAFARAVRAHPAWLADAWKPMSNYYVRNRDFHAAYELAKRFEKTPVLPQIPSNSDIEQLQRLLSANPDNYAAGFALYTEQKRRGSMDDALQTLRHFTAKKECPAYFHYLEAEGWATREDWERAWAAWQKFEAPNK
ncbi:MAG: O-antigen ligase family protein [Chthoniobacterales bacterium]